MQYRARTSRNHRTLTEAAERLQELQQEASRLLSAFPELRTRADARRLSHRPLPPLADDRRPRVGSALRAGRRMA